MAKSWWAALSPEAKKKYIAEHPGSKHAKGARRAPRSKRISAHHSALKHYTPGSKMHNLHKTALEHARKSKKPGRKKRRTGRKTGAKRALKMSMGKY